MKSRLIRTITMSFLLSCFACRYALLQAQDIPVAIPNLVEVPAGTIVIAMDNSNQANSGGYFNLKTYGLLVQLLNHSFSLKWVIKAGKVKDEIDFSAMAEKVYPGYQPAASLSFRSGPVLILPADTVGFHTSYSAYISSLDAGNEVNVYRLTENATVDIRYNLTRIPKVAILNDGGNAAVHTAYMVNASVPEVNYSITGGANLIYDCYTLATEPHVDSPGPYIDSIRNFVENGGNFLAQCEAIRQYENSSEGLYHTSAGVTITNTNINATASFPNADMGFSQINGTYNPSQGGSVRTWTFAAGSSPVNDFYPVATSSSHTTTFGAGVSKSVSGLGGLVFYIGNHEFSSLTNQSSINGHRMYLNAVLMPSAHFCNTHIWSVLPVQIRSFRADKHSFSSARIYWEVLHEEPGTTLYIERSSNGRDFTTLKRYNAEHSSTLRSYEYLDENALPGLNFYRLRTEQTSGAIVYSATRKLYFESNPSLLQVFPNPSAGQSFVRSDQLPDELCHMEIRDMSGRLLMKKTVRVAGGQFSIDISAFDSGMYVLMLQTGAGKIYKGRVQRK